MLIKVTNSPNEQKFIELLLYVARRSEGDGRFGAIKLNKILFASDFMAYQTFGKSITGHRYQKLAKGPAPKALVPIVNRLKVSGEIREEQRSYFGHIQKRIVALRDADLSVFTAQEIALVNDVLDAFQDGNATEVSNWSHTFIGWEVAELHEEIPYETVLIDTTPEPDESDIAFAESLKGVAAKWLADKKQHP